MTAAIVGGFKGLVKILSCGQFPVVQAPETVEVVALPTLQYGSQ